MMNLNTPSTSFDTFFEIDFGCLRVFASHVRFYTEDDKNYITYTDLTGKRYVKDFNEVTKVVSKTTCGLVPMSLVEIYKDGKFLV